MSAKLKTVFMGTPDFALPALKTCFEESHLLAVVSQPDRPRGRGHKLSPSPIKAQALEYGIPVFTPISLRKESPELTQWQEFANTNPFDLLVVVAYGNLLPQGTLDLPKIAPINIHASLLPRWRGAAPIQRCLEEGDLETGVCIQKMLLELDAGNVLLETHYKIPILHGAAELTNNLSLQAGELLKTFLQKLHAGTQTLSGVPQNTSFVTFAKKIEKSEAEFSKTWETKKFVNKVRAFNVWPKVSANFSWAPEPLNIKILAAKDSSVMGTSAPKPGTLFLHQNHVLLSCADGTAELLTVQLPGKAPQEAYSALQNFLNKTEKNELLLY